MMMNKRESYLTTNFNARSEEDGRLILEGYFIKYGVETELWPGFFELIGVSPCTFPAYPQTEIAARQKNYEDYKKEALNIRKNI